MNIKVTRRNVTNDFRIHFRYVIVHAKTTLSNGMPENVASRRILTKWQPQYFKEYKAISKIFAIINHQYMDIYHTKKQTENISRSCSYLLLKTLFHFISQCSSDPYLEIGFCKLD